MPKNIVERAIIPNNPSSNKVIHNNQYYLYAPVGGVNKVGMAGFNGSQFDVSNEQIVSVKSSFVDDLVDLVIERLEQFQRDEPWIENDVPDTDDYTTWFKPVSNDELPVGTYIAPTVEETTVEEPEITPIEDEPAEGLTELEVTEEPTEGPTELEVTEEHKE